MKRIFRIAPSPTGNMHIGTARTSVFNYLLKEKYNGELILRIEDTDKRRSKVKFEKNILEGLKWLGVSYDKFIRQSEQLEIHKKYLRQLISEDKAYISKEKSKEEPDSEVEVVRFRNSNTDVIFNDSLRGEIKSNTRDLGDFVIAKDVNTPLYNFAVVVDDAVSGVTDVVRGDDHLSNTARQILIQRALGFKEPVYTHLPLILNKQKAKLSKRDGALSVLEYKDEGYLSEAMVNYLSLLGWNHKGDNDYLTYEELKNKFDFNGLNKSPSVFDETKLKSINKMHLMKEDVDDFVKDVMGAFKKYSLIKYFLLHTRLKRAAQSLYGEISVVGEVLEMVNSGRLNYIFSAGSIKRDKVFFKNMSESELRENLENVISLIFKFDIINDVKQIKKAFSDLIEKKGTGEILHPLRYSLSGEDKSPDPYSMIFVLGKKESIRRIQNVKKIL